MAIKVKSGEGYVDPSKLWYKIDGEWKQIVSVYENPIQNELSLIDQKRVKYDKLNGGLETKIGSYKAIIAGLDTYDGRPLGSFTMEEKNQMAEELPFLEAQLTIARVEQTAVTKQYFTQKAQVEYLNLVEQGEEAVRKIIALCNVPDEWGIIKVIPLGKTDERLEVVINNTPGSLAAGISERVFRYGTAYYRIYEKSTGKDEDNVTTILNNCARRLDKAAYDSEVESSQWTSGLFEVKGILEQLGDYTQDGAKRIREFLASLEEQEKIILDSIPDVQAAQQVLLGGQVDENLSDATKEIIVIEEGTFKSSNDLDYQVNLGSVLLEEQGVTQMDELIDSETVQQAKDGTLNDPELVLALTKINEREAALNSKINTINDLMANNGDITQRLKDGDISLTTLTVYNLEKQSTFNLKESFWENPIDDSTVGSTKGAAWNQGYTASGDYIVGSDELMYLSTEHLYLISTILGADHNAEFGMSMDGPGDSIAIISVTEAGEIVFEEEFILGTTRNEIVQVVEGADYQATPADVGLGTFDTQEHTAIISAQDHQQDVYTPQDGMYMEVYHPVLNAVFFPGEYAPNSGLHIESEAYARPFNIRPYTDNNGSTQNSYSQMDAESFGIASTSLEPLEEKNDDIVNNLTTQNKVLDINDYFSSSLVMNEAGNQREDFVISFKDFNENEHTVTMGDLISTSSLNNDITPTGTYTTNDNIVSSLESNNSAWDDLNLFTGVLDTSTKAEQGYSQIPLLNADKPEALAYSQDTVIESGVTESITGMSIHKVDRTTTLTPEQEIMATKLVGVPSHEIEVSSGGAEAHNYIVYQVGLNIQAIPFDLVNLSINTTQRVAVQNQSLLVPQTFGDESDIRANYVNTIRTHNHVYQVSARSHVFNDDTKAGYVNEIDGNVNVYQSTEPLAQPISEDLINISQIDIPVVGNLSNPDMQIES